MYRERKISAVIPCYNEAGHVANVIKTMPDFVDRIILVDDSSQDRTAEAAATTNDPRLIILRNSSREGVGGATLIGFQKACELESDIIVKMDGDGQMAPEYLHQLLDPIIEEKYDYAKGNRFLAGESLELMPKHRLLGNIVLTFLTKLASGYWQIFDPQNGFVAILASTFKKLNLRKVHRGYFFENDMLVHLNLLNCRVVDVPIPARYADEVSDLNPWKVGLSFPLLLVRRMAFRVYQKYVLRDFSPISLFLATGALLFLWGTGFGSYIWIKSNLTGKATATGTIMLALLPAIFGFELLLQALVLDIQETPK